MSNMFYLITVIFLILLLAICFAAIFFLYILYKKEQYNYYVAKMLMQEIIKQLKEQHHIVDFKVITTAEKRIPMIVVHETRNVTEVRIPDNPEKILQITQALDTIEKSNGYISGAELEEIKKLVNN